MAFEEERTKSFPADDGREVTLGFAMDGSADATLKIDRPAFVEPATYEVREHSTASLSGGVETCKCSQLQLVTRLPLQL